jgi:hypothetical protein
MKRFAFATALVFLGAASSFASISAYVNKDVYVDLTKTTTTTIVNFSGSGTVHSLSCVIDSAVTGSPALSLLGNADSNAKLINDTLYSSGVWPFWDLPLIVSGTGTSAGDKIVIPMEFTYSSSLYVYFSPTTAASAGSMRCILSYTPTS